MAEQPSHDCGHACCDIRHVPIHRHTLTPLECLECAGIDQEYREALDRVRKLAEEIRAAQRFIPRRGDEVEAWLQRWCDNEIMPKSFDMLLDDYRAHADAGVPLSEEVERQRS